MAAPVRETSESMQFHQMGLDDRLIKAICNQRWKEPTLIQEKAIPLALEGKDILARARTGSGKTAAFAIPVVQKILQAKQTASQQQIRALVLTPTRELCHQAYTNFMTFSVVDMSLSHIIYSYHHVSQLLTANCSREVKCFDVSGHASLDAQRPLLQANPDIVIGTPSRIVAHLKAGNLDLKASLELLVIDEADLVFSFGYEKDVKVLLSYLPQIYQAILMSATLTDDVVKLKKLLLHNAVILKLEESQLPETSRLLQYHIKCEEEEKFVLIYALFKLRLVRGKSIVFVNDVNRCYRLKLYLEQFAIRSCVLNSELPINSRCHMVAQFNDGVYEIIISADEKMLDETSHQAAKRQKDKGKQKKSKTRRDKEAGVTRGIDFQFVSNVINFDFPRDVDSYIHRVGRTARGTNQGTALSFVSMAEQPVLDKVEDYLSEDSSDDVFKPYRFRMDEIDGFRYRALDAMRAVTSVAVREARLKEIKQEIVNSTKLKSFFEENPRDLELLRHDKALHMVKVQEHLKNVPDYIVPPTLRGIRRYDPERRRQKEANNNGQAKGPRGRAGPTNGQIRFQKRKADPLQSFEVGNVKKRKR